MASDQKTQMELPQDFERINPGFELSDLVAEESGALPYDWQEFPGTDRA